MRISFQEAERSAGPGADTDPAAGSMPEDGKSLPAVFTLADKKQSGNPLYTYADNWSRQDPKNGVFRIR